jgi:hypothetical protein
MPTFDISYDLIRQKNSARIVRQKRGKKMTSFVLQKMKSFFSLACLPNPAQEEDAIQVSSFVIYLKGSMQSFNELTTVL